MFLTAFEDTFVAKSYLIK